MRTRENLLRRYLTRQGISIHDYRIWVGAPSTESVEDRALVRGLARPPDAPRKRNLAGA